jgi:peroxiredoxin
VSRTFPSPPLYASLPLETLAPAFEPVDLDGRTQTLTSLREAGKSVFLIFSDPACGPCSTLLPQIGRWQRDLAEQMTIALISRGSRQTNFESAARYGLQHVLLQHDREVAALYRAYGTPSGVLIRPDGTIGSALAAGGREISSVVTTASTEVTMDDSGSDRVGFNDGTHAH